MSEIIVKSSIELFREAEFEFANTFKCDPVFKALAPGRVNLIGEHTDYNDGFVFPMALSMVTVVVGALNDTKDCHIVSLSSELKEANEVKFSLESSPLKRSDHKWANYVIGVVEHFPVAGNAKKGFNVMINSSVPLGSGLSSSAALEVAIFTFLEGAYGIKNITSLDKALVCQKAEHTYADSPCGIMDQFISTMAIKDHFLLIDCSDMSARQVAFNPAQDAALLITNSNIKHELGSSEYPLRRERCHSVARILGVKSLRHLTLNDLKQAFEKNQIDSMQLQRARHVVSENKRVQDAFEALKNNDMVMMGKLMSESHASLRDDFDVSCNEIDELVKIAQSCPGVYGTRITGGGFGGCTVTLLKKEAVFLVMAEIEARYPGNATFYVCKPAQGAHLLSQ